MQVTPHHSLLVPIVYTNTIIGLSCRVIQYLCIAISHMFIYNTRALLFYCIIMLQWLRLYDWPTGPSDIIAVLGTSLYNICTQSRERMGMV